MNYEDTKIVNLIRSYGTIRIFKSQDFIGALIISILLTIPIIEWDKSLEFIELLSPLFISTAAVLIAICIAGLAIIVSISDPNFVLWLMENKKYNNILTIYLISAIIDAVCIVTNIIVLVCGQFLYDYIDGGILIWACLFTFTYCILSTMMIIGTTLRYGIYRGELLKKIEKENNEKKNEK